MTELANCPFCGAPAELEHGSDHHGEWFNLGCSRHWGRDTDNKCLAGRIWYTETEIPEADAIAAWNRRAAPPIAAPADAEREKLAKSLERYAAAWEATDRAVTVICTALKQARREGAEQMREAAGKRIDDIATAWAQMPISQAYREIAISIRALPLPGDHPSTKESADG